MDNLTEQVKQCASGVQSGDKKRHNQETHLDRQCLDMALIPVKFMIRIVSTRKNQMMKGRINDFSIKL